MLLLSTYMEYCKLFIELLMFIFSEPFGIRSMRQMVENESFNAEMEIKTILVKLAGH